VISGFDSLTEAQDERCGRDAGMVREGFVAHLAYWGGLRRKGFVSSKLGRSSAKKRTRAQVERINREVVSSESGQPRHLLREELILARSEIAAAMKRAPEELEKGRRWLTSFTLSACTQGTSPGTTSRVDARLGKSW